MGIFVGIFLFGCLVTGLVALGLVFAMAALDADGPGAPEVDAANG